MCYDGLSEQKQDPNAGHISASEKFIIIISDKGWIFYFKSESFNVGHVKAAVWCGHVGHAEGRRSLCQQHTAEREALLRAVLTEQ